MKGGEGFSPFRVTPLVRINVRRDLILYPTTTIFKKMRKDVLVGDKNMKCPKDDKGTTDLTRLLLK